MIRRDGAPFVSRRDEPEENAGLGPILGEIDEISESNLSRLVMATSRGATCDLSLNFPSAAPGVRLAFTPIGAD